MWSVCGFFKTNVLELQQFLPLTESPLVFAARIHANLPSWHWNPALGGLVWVLDSSLLRYTSEFLSMWVLGQRILHLHPSYQSRWMWFLLFRSCQTSIQFNFWHCRVMVVLYFSCNFPVVVQRGILCLPTPHFLLEISLSFHVLIVHIGIALFLSTLFCYIGLCVCLCKYHDVLITNYSLAV